MGLENFSCAIFDYCHFAIYHLARMFAAHPLLLLWMPSPPRSEWLQLPRKVLVPLLCPTLSAHAHLCKLKVSQKYMPHTNNIYTNMRVCITQVYNMKSNTNNTKMNNEKRKTWATTKWKKSQNKELWFMTFACFFVCECVCCCSLCPDEGVDAGGRGVEGERGTGKGCCSGVWGSALLASF